MVKKTKEIEKISTEIKSLIDQSKKNVAVSINTEITLLYWTIGKRIREEVLRNKRASYGKEIVVSLAAQLR